MYLIANNFSWTNFKKTVKQMSAAGLTGFSTVSSAITMPVTIDATEVNIKDKPFARLIVPATVNIHMIGHGLSIPITSLTIFLTSEVFLEKVRFYAVRRILRPLQILPGYKSIRNFSFHAFINLY